MRGPKAHNFCLAGLTALSRAEEKKMGCRDSEKKISSEQLMVVCLSLGMACNIQVKERHRTREGA